MLSLVRELNFADPSSETCATRSIILYRIPLSSDNSPAGSHADPHADPHLVHHVPVFILVDYLVDVLYLKVDLQ
jgi:hypothetical protein